MIIESFNVVVHDQESNSSKIRKDNAETGLPYSNETSQNDSVSVDDASPSMTLYCDNISAFNLSKNPVQQSRPKHIKHYFIINMVEDKVIELKHIPTAHQFADTFTKGLDAFRFETLRSSLGLCSLTCHCFSSQGENMMIICRRKFCFLSSLYICVYRSSIVS